MVCTHCHRDLGMHLGERQCPDCHAWSYRWWDGATYHCAQVFDREPVAEQMTQHTQVGIVLATQFLEGHCGLRYCTHFGYVNAVEVAQSKGWRPPDANEGGR
jgi:hypothetical protein